MKFAAWYGFLVGVLMLAQWTFSIASGRVPEFKNAPWAIAFHLVGELATALALISGSIAAFRSRAWSKTILLTGLGMVMYSEIVSPGYFAQSGQWLPVLLFALLLFGAVWSIMLLLQEAAGSC